jgi:hypothetical protein
LKKPKKKHGPHNNAVANTQKILLSVFFQPQNVTDPL